MAEPKQKISNLRPLSHLIGLLVLLIAWGVVSLLIELPYERMARNLPDEISLNQYLVLIVSLTYWRLLAIFLLLCGVVANVLSQKKLRAADFWGDCGLVESLPLAQGIAWPWLASVLLVIAGAFFALERIQTHYFLQDDNYSQFLPGILYGCRTIWSGHWVTWNPYQLLGAPLTDLGVYAITYPVTHLSYLGAKYLLGDETRLLDLFCWFHLALAAIATFFAARRLRLPGPLAASVAVCYSLSGFSLLVSRSWYYMSPAVAALPLFVLLALQLPDDKPGWRWTLSLGTVTGLLFHAGNAQMWTYAVGFFVLLVVLRIWKQGSSWKRLLDIAPGLLIGLAIALPLLVPQVLSTRTAQRVPSGEGILGALMSTVYPYPLANAALPNRSVDPASPTGQLFYAGTVLTLGFFIGLAALLLLKGARPVLKQNPILTAAIVAFLLALGHQGGLWTLHTLLPLLNQFTFPAKFLPLFHFFTLLVGALLLARFGNAKLELACFGLVTALMLYHVSLAREALYVWGDAPSYAVSPQLLSTLRDDPGLQRIYPAAVERAPSPGYNESLNHNLATMFGIVSLEGYDPLWKNRPEMMAITKRLQEQPLETLRAYGVSHVLLHRTAKTEDLPVEGRRIFTERHRFVPQVLAVEKALRGQPVQFRTNNVEVIRLDGAEPLARAVAAPGTALAVSVKNNDVVVDTAKLPDGGNVRVNFLSRPGMVAFAGAQQLNISSDALQRIVVEVPAHTENFAVTYQINWQLPALGSLVLLLAAILLR